MIKTRPTIGVKAVIKPAIDIEQKILRKLNYDSTAELLHDRKVQAPGPSDYTPLKSNNVDSTLKNPNTGKSMSRDESERCIFTIGKYAPSALHGKAHDPRKLMGFVPGPGAHLTD